MKQSVVIIGASHAAAEAVTSLRRKGWEGRIIVIGEENLLPYQRPPLSKKYFSQELPAEKLLIKSEKAYDKAEAEFLLGVRAEKIDRTNQQIHLNNGEKVAYTYLLLATGARVRKLPVAGADLPNIHYLRTKKDVDGIHKGLATAKKILIVGAGYIGLEVAASARKAGKEVVVLEAMDRVLERVTSPIISEFYQNLHQSQGVDIRLGARLDHFVEKNGNKIAVLHSEEELSFDAAIIGIGVIPNTALAKEAGIICNNGIAVDKYTRTSAPNIFAVGDCCSHPNFIYNKRLRLESVPNAVGQAKTAASTICGEKVPYEEVPWFWSDQYDIKLQTVGLCQGYDQTIVRGDIAAQKFAVFYLKEGQLIAVDAINSPREFMASKKLVAAKAMPDSKRLADVEISMKEM